MFWLDHLKEERQKIYDLIEAENICIEVYKRRNELEKIKTSQKLHRSYNQRLATLGA